MPPNTSCVTRPGKWGNPFDTGKQFREILAPLIEGDLAIRCSAVNHRHMLRIAQEIRELRGFNLACWCPVVSCCHADVLLEYANRRMQK